MSIFRFTNDAFDDILRLQRAMEGAMTTPFFGLDWSPSGRGIYPALNIFEDGDTLVLKAQVPGLDRESLKVELEENHLMLAGTAKVHEAPEDSRYHRRERRAREFRRAFRLPYEVDPEKASASYEDGILTVRLEKAEAAKPRQIAVQG